MKKRLQKILVNEDNTEKVVDTYIDIKDAAKHIDSKSSDMAIQLNIAWAILTNTKAYQHKWKYNK